MVLKALNFQEADLLFFGIFEKGDGEKVFEEIKDKYTFTALCHPINYGIEIIETE